MTKTQIEAMSRTRAAKAKAAVDDATTINVDLPKELHRRLKIACVIEGLTFSQAVTQAVADWTKERGQ